MALSNKRLLKLNLNTLRDWNSCRRRSINRCLGQQLFRQASGKAAKPAVASASCLWFYNGL